MTEPVEIIQTQFAQQKLRYNDRLSKLLPKTIAGPLAEFDVKTVEDLYECAAAAGASWFRSVPGITSEIADALMLWLLEYGSSVGEVTARFFLPGHVPEDLVEGHPDPATQAPWANSRIVPLENLTLPEKLTGEFGINRAPATACALDAQNDLEAIRSWLNARASNPNTFGNYRKEAERFLLWCLLERQTALSSIKAGDAALYLRWLEGLGRTDNSEWDQRWYVPQCVWIGPKNAPRHSDTWRPFNGPLQAASRRNAIIVVRLLFSFLLKTGYLIFNPFDQVSPKVPLLKGEGAPQAFADRSLTDDQWGYIVDHIETLKEGWPRERMKLILMMGKSLGMRASEILEARTGWIVQRRLGFKTRTAIEIVGKGSKVRRLPLNPEQLEILQNALRSRGIVNFAACDPNTPLVINLGRGRNPHRAMTRSGLYRALETFINGVADSIQDERPMDAAKLRASSTHWLRHTFAVNALQQMDVNIVQHAMGHSSVATTGRYLSPEDEAMNEAMEKMPAL